jgi:S-formylglutathione hydrolase FrmB
MGSWSEVKIAGHSCDVFEPTEPNPHGYVVLYLHGVHLDMLRDQPAYTEQLEKHGLICVAPLTQRSWWTDRICEEFDSQISAEAHLLDNVLPYIQERWQTPERYVGLLGTSMGGQGALRIAYKNPRTFPVVVAISPAIDFHTRYDEGDETICQMYPDKEAARQDTALLYVHPLDYPRHQFFCCDPGDERWWDSSDRLHMKLGSTGVLHDYDLETEGGGHGFEYYNRMAATAIEFLAERLDRDRRRVE